MKTEPLSRDRAGAVNAGALVLECERARCRALVEGDIASIEAMLAEELVYVHAPGTVQNKEQLLEFLRTRVRYQSVQRGRLAVHGNADVVWTTGLMRLLGTRATTGERIAATSFVTQIWRLHEGQCRLCVLQSTSVAESIWPTCGETEEAWM